MPWRKIFIGSLLTLVLAFSLIGARAPQASANLPGLQDVVGSALVPGLGLSAQTTFDDLQSIRDWMATLLAPRTVHAMNSFDCDLAAVPGGSSEAETNPVAAAPVQPAATPAPAVPENPAPESALPESPAPESATPDTPATQPTPSTGETATPGPAGYMNYTVQQGDDLESLAATFATTASVIADASGIPVDQTLYPGMMLRIPTDDPSKVEPQPTAVALDWWTQVDALWPIGTVAQVTDVWTGNVFYVLRQGGWAHADCEPISPKDTATMLSDYGGEWSWNRRPIVVVVNGYRIAASQNGMPHGDEILYDNNFGGEFCIHFLNSTTHGSSYTVNGVPTLDPAHQRCVQEAVGH